MVLVKKTRVVSYVKPKPSTRSNQVAPAGVQRTGVSMVATKRTLNIVKRTVKDTFLGRKKVVATSVKARRAVGAKARLATATTTTTTTTRPSGRTTTNKTLATKQAGRSLISSATKLQNVKSIRVSSSSTASVRDWKAAIPTATAIATAASSNTSSSNVTSMPKTAKKDYLTAGLYCQNARPSSSKTLVSQVIQHHNAENKASAQARAKAKNEKKKTTSPGAIASNRPRRSLTATTVTPKAIGIEVEKLIKAKGGQRPTFPPLPYDFGYDLFFGTQHEFVLPQSIRAEAESGALDGKKKPAGFTKVRANLFVERSRISAGYEAVCKCPPDSGCEERCINRLMSYTCGKDCPCGDKCTNKVLNKRKTPAYKVSYTGARGFGIFAMEDIEEGAFVMDYRGEIISMDTFWDRIQNEYKGKKNFYALEYDQDEVIDAGMKGNDARFINHGCNPNLEVRKYQTLGDGWEEYEVGMWALRDIKKGEELFYDYNFESFGVAAQSDELRTKCQCGAPNCVGFLGRKEGEKSAREIAADLEARRVEEARAAMATKGRKKGNKTMTGTGTPSLISASTSSGSMEIVTPPRSGSGSGSSTASSKKRKGQSGSRSGLIEGDDHTNDPNTDVKRPKFHVKGPTKAELAAIELQKRKELLAQAKRHKEEETKKRKEEEAREAKKRKEEEVKRRNGAPRGWAYVPLKATGKVQMPSSAVDRVGLVQGNTQEKAQGRKAPKVRGITGPAAARRSLG